MKTLHEIISHLKHMKDIMQYPNSFIYVQGYISACIQNGILIEKDANKIADELYK
jgi:hypothetical protein